MRKVWNGPLLLGADELLTATLELLTPTLELLGATELETSELELTATDELAGGVLLELTACSLELAGTLELTADDDVLPPPTQALIPATASASKLARNGTFK